MVEAVKPFLKWAGGKHWLVQWVSELAPATFGRYYEPFLGAGWFFFSLRPRLATLSDKNNELVDTYKSVAANPEGVLRALSAMRYSRDRYYEIRASSPRSDVRAAARFIYLNRTAWNGLYRVNHEGRFNVPFGTFVRPLDRVADRVVRAASVLRRVRICRGDFEAMLVSAEPGDFVYLDPPYVSAHRDNGFDRYNAKVFGWADQIRLRDVIHELTKRDVQVLMSNADHPSIQKLYRELQITRISRKSLVAGSTTHRTAVTELLLSNYRFRWRAQ
jgi:DNA adenine methylase